MRSLLTISLLVLASQAALAQGTTIGGHLTVSQRLTLAGSPYRVTSDLYVDPGVTLSVDPGVVFRFVAARGLYVDGSLSVEGTEANPVVFTSDGSFTPGVWAGIGFGTGKSKPGDPTAVGAATGSLTWCWVQYAGLAGAFPLPGQPNRAAGVFAYRSSVSMESVTVETSGGDGVYWFFDAAPARTLAMHGCTVTGSSGDGLGIGASLTADAVTANGNAMTNNGAYPVRVPAAALGVGVSGNAFTGNGAGGARNGIAVSAGALSQNVTLPSDALWFILGPITVPGALTLTVSDGDTILFPSGGLLQVNGRLVVSGTTASPAVFGADATVPEAGFWSGVGLGAGAQCQMSHAAVRHAGYPDAFTVPGVANGLRTAALFAYQADVSLTDVAFENAGGDGVLWYNGGTGAVARTLSATGCAFTNVESDGIEVELDTALDTVVVSGGVYSGIGGYPVLAPFRRAPGITDTGTVGISGGAMDADASLPATTFHVLMPVSVDVGRTLVLPAGCTLKFASDAWLDVYGTLQSNGTTSAPVTLTTTSTTPAPGVWGGLGLQTGASATLIDTDIRWAGQAGAFFVSSYGSVRAGVLANRAAVSATRLRVTGSGGDGVFYYNSGTTARGLNLTVCTTTDNAGDGVRIQRFATGDTATLDALETSRNGGYGLNSVVAGAGVTMTGITAAGNTKAPVRFPADALPKLSAGSFTGNGLDNAVALTGGTMPSPVMTPHSLYLEANVTIAAAATLTLSPGVSVTARPNVALLVSGGLNAVGAAGSPVAFRPDGATSWSGVVLMPGASGNLAHVTFLGAGIPGAVTIAPVTNAGAALTAYQADVSLTDAQVTGGLGDGVLLVNDSTTPKTATLTRLTVTGAAKNGVNLYAAPANEALSLSEMQISGCGGVAVAMPFRALYGLGGGSSFSGNAGGDGIAASGIAGTTATLSRDATVPTGARLFARSYLTVAPGATLTLPKGTEFRSAPGAGLRVDGALIADGAPESPILFTADGSSPAPATWQSLGFSATSKGTLNHVEVRYAGSPTSMPGYSAMAGSLIIAGGDVTLNGGLIRDGAGSNVILRGASTKLTSARTTLLSSSDAAYVRLVDDAGQGIRTFGGATETGCDFLGFTADAVKNTGAATLYARYCFWGMPDGPAPFGGGSGVQGNVDFLPYASTLVNGPVALLSGPTWTGHAPVALTITAAGPYFAGAVLKTGLGETVATYSAPVEGVAFAWDATGVPDGVYTFRLTTTDRIGRTATDEWTIVVGSGPPHSGDLDANGAVDLADAAHALRVAAGLDAAPSWVAAAADVRPKPGTVAGVGDGFVSLDDAAAIARKAADPGMEWP